MRRELVELSADGDLAATIAAYRMLLEHVMAELAAIQAFAGGGSATRH